MPSTYTPIASTTLGSAQNTITFNSISGSYTDLVLNYQVQTSDGSGFLNLTFNNDSSAIYSNTRLFGNSGGAQSNRGSNTSNFQIDAARNSDNLGSFFVQHNIQNYSNSTTFKTMISRESEMNYDYVSARVFLYRSTSPITRIDIIANSTTFTAGSTATLYGIKAV